MPNFPIDKLGKVISATEPIYELGIPFDESPKLILLRSLLTPLTTTTTTSLQDRLNKLRSDLIHHDITPYDLLGLRFQHSPYYKVPTMLALAWSNHLTPEFFFEINHHLINYLHRLIGSPKYLMPKLYKAELTNDVNAPKQSEMEFYAWSVGAKGPMEIISVVVQVLLYQYPLSTSAILTSFSNLVNILQYFEGYYAELRFEDFERDRDFDDEVMIATSHSHLHRSTAKTSSFLQQLQNAPIAVSTPSHDIISNNIYQPYVIRSDLRNLLNVVPSVGLWSELFPSVIFRSSSTHTVKEDVNYWSRYHQHYMPSQNKTESTKNDIISYHCSPFFMPQMILNQLFITKAFNDEKRFLKIVPFLVQYNVITRNSENTLVWSNAKNASGTAAVIKNDNHKQPDGSASKKIDKKKQKNNILDNNNNNNNDNESPISKILTSAFLSSHYNTLSLTHSNRRLPSIIHDLSLKSHVTTLDDQPTRFMNNHTPIIDRSMPRTPLSQLAIQWYKNTLLSSNQMLEMARGGFETYFIPPPSTIPSTSNNDQNTTNPLHTSSVLMVPSLKTKMKPHGNTGIALFNSTQVLPPLVPLWNLFSDFVVQNYGDLFVSHINHEFNFARSDNYNIQGIISQMYSGISELFILKHFRRMNDIILLLDNIIKGTVVTYLALPLDYSQVILFAIYCVLLQLPPGDQYIRPYFVHFLPLIKQRNLSTEELSTFKMQLSQQSDLPNRIIAQEDETIVGSDGTLGGQRSNSYLKSFYDIHSKHLIHGLSVEERSALSKERNLEKFLFVTDKGSSGFDTIAPKDLLYRSNPTQFLSENILPIFLSWSSAYITFPHNMTTEWNAFKSDHGDLIELLQNSQSFLDEVEWAIAVMTGELLYPSQENDEELVEKMAQTSLQRLTKKQSRDVFESVFFGSDVVLNYFKGKLGFAANDQVIENSNFSTIHAKNEDILLRKRVAEFAKNYLFYFHKQNHYSLITFLLQNLNITNLDLFFSMIQNTQQSELLMPITIAQSAQRRGFAEGDLSLPFSITTLFLSQSYSNTSVQPTTGKNDESSDKKRTILPKDRKRHKSTKKSTSGRFRTISTAENRWLALSDRVDRRVQTDPTLSKSIQEAVDDDNSYLEQPQIERNHYYLLSLLIDRHYPVSILEQFSLLPLDYNYIDSHGMTVLGHCLFQQSYNDIFDFVKKIVAQTDCTLLNLQGQNYFSLLLDTLPYDYEIFSPMMLLLTHKYCYDYCQNEIVSNDNEGGNDSNTIIVASSEQNNSTNQLSLSDYYNQIKSFDPFNLPIYGTSDVIDVLFKHNFITWPNLIKMLSQQRFFTLYRNQCDLVEMVQTFFDRYLVGNEGLSSSLSSTKTSKLPSQSNQPQPTLLSHENEQITNNSNLKLTQFDVIYIIYLLIDYNYSPELVKNIITKYLHRDYFYHLYYFYQLPSSLYNHLHPTSIHTDPENNSEKAQNDIEQVDLDYHQPIRIYLDGHSSNAIIYTKPYYTSSASKDFMATSLSRCEEGGLSSYPFLSSNDFNKTFQDRFYPQLYANGSFTLFFPLHQVSVHTNSMNNYNTDIDPIRHNISSNLIDLILSKPNFIGYIDIIMKNCDLLNFVQLNVQSPSHHYIGTTYLSTILGLFYYDYQTYSEHFNDVSMMGKIPPCINFASNNPLYTVNNQNNLTTLINFITQIIPHLTFIPSTSSSSIKALSKSHGTIINNNPNPVKQSGTLNTIDMVGFSLPSWLLFLHFTYPTTIPISLFHLTTQYGCHPELPMPFQPTRAAAWFAMRNPQKIGYSQPLEADERLNTHPKSGNINPPTSSYNSFTAPFYHQDRFLRHLPPLLHYMCFEVAWQNEGILKPLLDHFVYNYTCVNSTTSNNSHDEVNNSNQGDSNHSSSSVNNNNPRSNNNSKSIRDAKVNEIIIDIRSDQGPFPIELFMLKAQIPSKQQLDTIIEPFFTMSRPPTTMTNHHHHSKLVKTTPNVNIFLKDHLTIECLGVGKEYVSLRTKNSDKNGFGIHILHILLNGSPPLQLFDLLSSHGLSLVYQFPRPTVDLITFNDITDSMLKEYLDDLDNHKNSLSNNATIPLGLAQSLASLQSIPIFYNFLSYALLLGQRSYKNEIDAREMVEKLFEIGNKKEMMVEQYWVPELLNENLTPRQLYPLQAYQYQPKSSKDYGPVTSRLNPHHKALWEKGIKCYEKKVLLFPPSSSSSSSSPSSSSSSSTKSYPHNPVHPINLRGYDLLLIDTMSPSTGLSPTLSYGSPYYSFVTLFKEPLIIDNISHRQANRDTYSYFYNNRKYHEILDPKKPKESEYSSWIHNIPKFCQGSLQKIFSSSSLYGDIIEKYNPLYYDQKYINFMKDKASNKELRDGHKKKSHVGHGTTNHNTSKKQVPSDHQNKSSLSLINNDTMIDINKTNTNNNAQKNNKRKLGSDRFDVILKSTGGGFDTVPQDDYDYDDYDELDYDYEHYHLDPDIYDYYEGEDDYDQDEDEDDEEQTVTNTVNTTDGHSTEIQPE